MSSSPNKVPTPHEDFERAALKLALYKKLEKEAMEAENAPEEPELLKQSESSYKRVMGLIRKRVILDRFRRISKQGLSKAAQIVLVLLVLAEVAFVTAVASSGTVRKSVIEFLMEHTDEYTKIGFQDTGIDIDVPSDWNEPYYLSYVPDGFELIGVFSYDDSQSVALFADDTNNQIELLVGTTHSFTHIDSENAIISYADVRGQNATMIKNDSICQLVWRSGDSFIVLSTNMSEDILIELANGVVLIAS